jgi:hypothetical protein
VSISPATLLARKLSERLDYVWLNGLGWVNTTAYPDGNTFQVVSSIQGENVVDEAVVRRFKVTVEEA